MIERANIRKGKLSAVPNVQLPNPAAPKGLLPLGLDKKRDALLYVPANYNLQPLPLAVMLHGAGGHADHGMWLLQELADKANLLLLAPPSRSKSSWDLISNDELGPDVLFINEALEQTFEQYAVDPVKVAIGGFSDGASYAFTLGLTNGNLFTHIIAFSPGFAFTPETHGMPKVFISHGTQDDVLPIDPCSRSIVPKLKSNGYAVNYHEFKGPHIIPDDIKQKAVDWLLED